MTFALLLELCHHVGHHAQTVRDGRWTASADFCYWDHPLIELEGLTMGLIGCGRIGQAVARLALAFGMRVMAHDPSRAASPMPEVTLVDLETVFRESDVLSLHCPLTAGNVGLVNAEHLAWMKPTAFLLNTSRGPLIDAQALADALRAGTLAGAGLDVLAVEPPPADNPLLTAPRCLITPHISWATRAARARLLATAVENVAAFLRGAPQHVVNAPVRI
jgi:glycerate dehydrogenase